MDSVNVERCEQLRRSSYKIERGDDVTGRGEVACRQVWAMMVQYASRKGKFGRHKMRIDKPCVIYRSADKGRQSLSLDSRAVVKACVRKQAREKVETGVRGDEGE